MSPWSVGDTVVGAVEKDDEEATVWRCGHPPRGQQSVRDLRAISVTPLGNGAPRRGIPSCAPFPLPRATPPSLLYQRCVGMAAQGRGKARQPNGPERLEGLERRAVVPWWSANISRPSILLSS